MNFELWQSVESERCASLNVAHGEVGGHRSTPNTQQCSAELSATLTACRVKAAWAKWAPETHTYAIDNVQEAGRPQT